MSIIKPYEETLNLSAVECFGDIRATILTKLRRRFENRCAGKMLVQRVLDDDSLQYSQIRCAKDRMDGSANVDVRFHAEAIAYGPGDILPNCRLDNVNKSQYLVFSHPHAIVNVRWRRELAGLKPGSQVALIIGRATYTPYKEQIVIEARMYNYPYTVPVILLNLSDASSREEISILQAALDRVKEQMAALEKAPTRIVQLLNDTYYPREETYADLKRRLPKSVQVKNLLTMTADYLAGKGEPKGREPTLIFRHPLVDKQTPDVWQMSVADWREREGELFVQPFRLEVRAETHPALALRELLRDLSNHLHVLQEMSTYFDSEQKIKEYDAIWLLYASSKRRPAS